MNQLLMQAADPAWRARIRSYANSFASLEGPTYAEKLRDLALRLSAKGTA